MKEVLITLLILFCTSATAQIKEQKDGQIVASVHDRMLTCYAYQQRSNWCWAASLQMVLAYYKMNVSQATLVKRAFGKTPDRAASAQEMVKALDGYQKGKRRVACYADSVIDLRQLVAEIEEGHPVVVGMAYQGQQHAMVLTQIFFQPDAAREGKINPVQVVVVDPSRQFLKERRFSWAEFCRMVNMVLRIRVSDYYCFPS